MRLEIPFELTNGKIIVGNQKIKDIISGLNDGQYVMVINSTNPLVTKQDYRKAYFAMVDTCVANTGNQRYTIHNEFKKHLGIESTNTFSLLEWKEALEKFKFFAYNTMDCIV